MREAGKILKSKGSPHCCVDGSNHIAIQRSWRSIIPAVLFASILGLLSYALCLNLGVTSVPVDLGFAGDINLSLPLLILLVAIARPLALMYNCKHEFTCHHARTVTGLTSLKREQVEVPYEDILGVRVKQRFIQRLLNVGSILAWTASADNPELVMLGIGDPYDKAKLLEERIDEALIETRRRQSTGESVEPALKHAQF